MGDLTFSAGFYYSKLVCSIPNTVGTQYHHDIQSDNLQTSTPRSGAGVTSFTRFLVIYSEFKGFRSLLASQLFSSRF